MSLPQVEGYKVLRTVGAGGMAELFLAERTGAGGACRRVVLKRILPGLAGDPEFRDRFVHEARIALQLTHANIVQVYDFIETGGTYLLEMEHVEGCDLRRLLTAGTLQPDAALYLAIEVLRGLDYAHRRLGSDGLPLDIVHRDVSPGNILISREGEVKVTDFGLARSRELLARSHSGVKGTFAFLSPEQATGLPVDVRADIFAVGAVLYAALTGRSPFEGNGPLETLERVRAARFSPLSGEGALALLNPILLRAMAQDPTARYESAGAFRAALEAWAQTMALALGPSPLSERVCAVHPGASPAPPSPAIVGTTAPATVESHPTRAERLPLARPPGTHPLSLRPPGKRRRWAIVGGGALLLAGLAALFQWWPGQSVVATSRRPPEAVASTPAAVAPAASVEPTRADERPPPAARRPPMDRPRPAYLTVSADPWAFVTIDGRKRGTTPLKQLALTPGSHEVVLDNPPLGATRARLVRLTAGEHKTLIESLAGQRP